MPGFMMLVPPMIMMPPIIIPGRRSTGGERRPAPAAAAVTAAAAPVAAYASKGPPPMPEGAARGRINAIVHRCAGPPGPLLAASSDAEREQDHADPDDDVRGGVGRDRRLRLHVLNQQ